MDSLIVAVAQYLLFLILVAAGTAAALAGAGVVRGMELYIHSALVSFASWASSLTRRVAATKLMPETNRVGDRHLGRRPARLFLPHPAMNVVP